MPEYLHPGVFIEETNDRPHDIAGVPTATAGFVGFATRGAVDTPITVGSIAEYEAAFGKISAVQPLSSSVEAYFMNGGTKAVIVRAHQTEPSGRGRRVPDDLIGTAETKTGLNALSRSRDGLGLLVVPDAAYFSASQSAQVAKAAASFAEAQGIFHILDIPNAVASKGHDAAVQWAASSAARSKNMAIYHPWLMGAGGGRAGAKKRPMPPSAIAAGIYARLDQAHGVWKAPAGRDAATINIPDLAANVTDADAAKLQSASINAIRRFAGTGVVLWGARTFAADDDTDWRYVNIRRLGLFIENSIVAGLSWVVFEPNGEALWAQIRLEISSFMHTAWRAGAFQGARPEDAYFVRCDATTMTPNDINKGRIIVMIGFAPVKPAEFLILRIEFSIT